MICSNASERVCPRNSAASSSSALKPVDVRVEMIGAVSFGSSCFLIVDTYILVYSIRCQHLFCFTVDPCLVYLYTGSGMPRKKPDGAVVNFQLKLYGEEAERWLRVRNQAKQRNPYINDTVINRRLLGLDSDAGGEVTDRDRMFFLGGAAAKPELIGRAKSGKPHIKEVSRKKITN